jgi:DNA-directed RNA polymerase specialized sigma24 family protein
MPKKKEITPEEDKKKKKKVKDQYYTIDEEVLQLMISKAKAGDKQTQQELLTTFDNFLKKYVNLLFYGKYSLNDYDIRKFIGLFITDANTRIYLRRNSLNDKGRKQVAESFNGIVYMTKRYCTIEDVRQTVQFTFFQCLNRYERKGSIPFSGFLYSYFFYMLKKNVDQYLIDQLGRKTFPLITDEERNSDDGEDSYVQFVGPSVPSAESLIGADIIDELWVAGETAMAPFDNLTMQERQLIKWRFIDGFKSSEIARKTTEHPNTVRDHFNKIRAKLKDILGEDFDIMLED